MFFFCASYSCCIHHIYKSSFVVEKSINQSIIIICILLFFSYRLTRWYVSKCPANDKDMNWLLSLLVEWLLLWLFKKFSSNECVGLVASAWWFPLLASSLLRLVEITGWSSWSCGCGCCCLLFGLITAGELGGVRCCCSSSWSSWWSLCWKECDSLWEDTNQEMDGKMLDNNNPLYAEEGSHAIPSH